MPIIEYENGQVDYQPPGIQRAYPVWSFPPIIRDAVNELSLNVQVPVESAAHAALGVVSLVCQNFVNVQCPPYDPASVALFLMTVSKSSGGKSLAELRFRREIVAFERKQEEAVNTSMSDYRAEMKIWEDDGRRLAKEYIKAKPGSADAEGIRAQRLQHEKARPVKPKKREMRFEEMSPPGLRDALVENHAVGILSPDAGHALNGMTFSQPATLSGYWSGEDRPVGLASGNRRPVEPRLTIAVQTQEDQFETFMKSRRGSDAFGTGLLGRFLVAFPKIVDWPGQSTQIEERPEPKLDFFNQRVADILNQTFPAPCDRLTLKLSDDAKRYWAWFKDAVHNELICGNFSEAMKSFFRKVGQHATRFAALFHSFDGKGGDISAEAMKGAIAVCEWYVWEYIRVFTPYAPSPQQQSEEITQSLLQWLQKATAEPLRYPKLTPGRYTTGDLARYSSIRGNPEALEVAINKLHWHGHIAVQDGPKGGRIIFYPPDKAPPQPSNLNNYRVQGPSTQSNINAPLNDASTTAAKNSISPDQQSIFNNISANGSNFGGGVPENINSTDLGNRIANMDFNSFDSEEMRAVKREIDKSAAEMGIGPVTVSVRLCQG
jgi:hypothetical protein